jgi:GNAT superfamily N-acetyltransferase
MTPPDRVTVRQAEPKDAHAAAEVLRRSITELCVADHRGDLDTIEKWLANKTPQNILAWLANDDNFCVVADENDRLAGIGLLHREGEIRLCYLAPGEQRRGIGKAIYLALEAKAKAWGVHKLRLESTVAARSFYERLGYRAAGAARPGFGVCRTAIPTRRRCKANIKSRSRHRTSSAPARKSSPRFFATTPARRGP